MTKYVDNRINELESEILQNTGVISYSDTFINYSNSDMELVEDVKANIDISAGALTLDKISIINQPTPNIAITDKSTGLPGDTHQAYISGEEITYSGELDQHTNLQYLTDGEKDTWFEYEELQIPQNEYDKVNGYGFEYKEGYRWIMDSSTNSLTLELELTYKKPYNMNWIMIDPFLPVESSYIPASITTVDITDSKGIVTQLVVDAISFRRETILMFSMQKVKKITIRLKQENKYITRIGHTYYTNLDTNQNMLNTINPDSIRIDGPAPSIEYIGIKYEPATGRYIQPIMDELYNPPDSRKIFTELNNDPRVYTGNELINAYRYQIAIRSIETACIEFGTISQYLSQNFDFSTLNNANRLKLIVDSEDNKGTIVYSISIDNGVNWRSITNNEELELASFTNARLKIDMIRDPLDKYSSPVIYNYSLQGRKV
jgi:hypothetical protein